MTSADSTSRSALAVCAILAAACPFAAADAVAYGFEGDLTYLEDPGNHCSGATRFTGVFAFDAGALDANPDPQIGEYAGLTLQMEFGPAQVAAPAVSISVYDDEPVPLHPDEYWDRITVAGSGTAPGGIVLSYFGLGLVDTSSLAITSDALPLALQWSDFNDIGDGHNISVGLTFPDGAPVYAAGTITLLTPEPPTFPLLLLGAAAALRARRRDSA